MWAGEAPVAAAYKSDGYGSRVSLRHGGAQSIPLSRSRPNAARVVASLDAAAAHHFFNFIYLESMGHEILFLALTLWRTVLKALGEKDVIALRRVAISQEEMTCVHHLGGLNASSPPAARRERLKRIAARSLLPRALW